MTASTSIDTKEGLLTVKAEGSPTEQTLKDILKKISELLFHQRVFENWKNQLDSRHHPPDSTPDTDYPRRPRENEGGYEPQFRMGNYQEGPSSWQQWVMKILATILATGIPAVIWELSSINSKLSSIVATQAVTTEAQNERMKALEERTSRLESRVYQ